MTDQKQPQNKSEKAGSLREDPKMLHKRQRSKNFIVGGLVLAFVAIIYFVSIVKLSSVVG